MVCIHGSLRMSIDTWTLVPDKSAQWTKHQSATNLLAVVCFCGFFASNTGLGIDVVFVFGFQVVGHHSNLAEGYLMWLRNRPTNPDSSMNPRDVWIPSPTPNNIPTSDTCVFLSKPCPSGLYTSLLEAEIVLNWSGNRPTVDIFKEGGAV